MPPLPPYAWNMELLRLWVGLLGAVSYAAMRPDPTWRRFGLTVGIGTVIASIGPPWMCEIFSWQGVHAANAVTYVAGFTGNTVATFVLTALETWFPDTVKSFIQRWLGRDPSSSK